MKKIVFISLGILLAVFGIAFTFTGKRERVKTVQEYFKWISKEENGLVKTKYVNSTEIKVKYIPAEYSAYRELQGMERFSKKQSDSLVDYYGNSLTFSLSLGPDEREGKEKQGDIMYRDVYEYKDYAQRSYDMNFNMKEYIALKAGDKEYKPVLVAMENIYSLDKKRSILLVFVPDTKEDKNLFKNEKLEFIYDDNQFSLGKNYFVFEREKLNHIPEFPFNSLIKN